MAGQGRNWKCQITAFITVDLKAHTGARTKSISFKGLHKPCFEAGTGDPTFSQSYACKTCQTVVPLKSPDRLSGYEIARGEYVPLTEEEIAAQVPAASDVLKVEAIVPRETISRFRRDTMYYLGPADPPRKSKGKVAYGAGHKVFQLVRDYLAQANAAMIVSYVDHGHEKLALIEADDPALVMFEAFFDSEIPNLEDAGFKPDTFQAVPVAPDEANMFAMVLGTLPKTFDWSAVSDGYIDRLIEIASAKRDGKVIEAKPKATASAEPSDLLAALQASLAASGASKPAAAIKPEPKPAAKKSA